jgi:hypothetical protein
MGDYRIPARPRQQGASTPALGDLDSEYRNVIRWFFVVRTRFVNASLGKTTMSVITRPNSLAPAFFLVALLASAREAPADQIVKRFRETENFANPGWGWLTTRRRWPVCPGTPDRVPVRRGRLAVARGELDRLEEVRRSPSGFTD